MNMSGVKLLEGLPGISRDEISIGVEVEIILVNLPEGTDVVNERLRGENASTSFELIRRALAPVEGTLAPQPDGTVSVFDVKGDATIDADDYPGIAGGVEITTPILRNGDWVSVIPDMCNAIIKGVSDADAEIKLNESTGLHVHIGVGRNYTLDELKRVTKAIVVFEKTMDAHHPVSRNGILVLGYANYIQSCLNSPLLKGKTILEMVERLDKAATFQELCGTICSSSANRPFPFPSDRNYKYNFESILYFGTIEFRQADGTINPVWIVKWIEYVIKFVIAAVDTPDETYLEWALLDGGPTDLETLERFGLPLPTELPDIHGLNTIYNFL